MGDLAERITVDLEQCGGRPCIRGMRIRVTDVETFQLLMQIYAQVCDEDGCHEFRAVVGSDGLETHFSEYRGRFGRQPWVGGSERRDVN